MKEFKKQNLKKLDIVLEWNRLEITKQSFDEIITINGVPNILITFYSYYLLERQKLSPNYFNRKNKNRIYVICLEVQKYH